jgi:mannose-6-phosphate isomerase
MLDLKAINTSDKWSILRAIKDELILPYKLLMDDVDEQKPWGAYYRFTGTQKEKFLELFYKDTGVNPQGDCSPKILVFEPGKKISLQYHDRRDEIWKVLYGTVEAYFGQGDAVGEYQTYQTDEIFTYDAKTRHKGGAANGGWAVVAEIWQHTDPNNLSDEADNVRLADDFGRV